MESLQKPNPRNLSMATLLKIIFYVISPGALALIERRRIGLDGKAI